MEIMESNHSADAEAIGNHPAEVVSEKKHEHAEDAIDKEKNENIFSDENIMNDSVVNTERTGVTITSEDKVSFIDSVVSNTRFTKDYSLFGGRLKFTLRSLTSDEVSALASWSAKIGTMDSAGLVSGKYRKYLLSAHVAMLNGVEMPPLEEPLYEKLGGDGMSTVEPGWIKRCGYWDKVGFGQFQAILKCVGEFDALYSSLCGKAEDANFWNPDTP